jgi:hypothetical protein
MEDKQCQYCAHAVRFYNDYQNDDLAFCFRQANLYLNTDQPRIVNAYGHCDGYEGDEPYDGYTYTRKYRDRLDPELRQRFSESVNARQVYL